MFLLIVCSNLLTIGRCFAQIRIRVYYDMNWKITNERNAAFYSDAGYDTLRRYFEGEVKDFTIEGKLFMEGHYHLGEKNGPFTFYFPESGTVSSEGSYERNYRTGAWKFYYANGQLKQVIKFKYDVFSVLEYYNEKGHQKVKDGNGRWEQEMDAGIGNPVVLEGEFKNGKKNGIWTYHLLRGTILAEEVFDEGVFISGERRSNSVSEYRQSFIKPDIFEPAYFVIVENFKYSAQVDQSDYPFFKFLPKDGSLNKFYSYIQKNIQYPEVARKNKIEGKVIVSFEVYADGSIKNVKILKGLEMECNEEVVRVIKQLPPDIFTVTDQKEIKTLPITFRLQ